MPSHDGGSPRLGHAHGFLLRRGHLRASFFHGIRFGARLGLFLQRLILGFRVGTGFLVFGHPETIARAPSARLLMRVMSAATGLAVASNARPVAPRPARNPDEAWTSAGWGGLVALGSRVLSLRLEQVAPGVSLEGIPPDGRLPLRPTLSFGRVASCDVLFRGAHLAGHVNFTIHLQEGRAFLVSNYSRDAVRVNGVETIAREPVELLFGSTIEPMDVLTWLPAAWFVVVEA